MNVAGDCIVGASANFEGALACIGRARPYVRVLIAIDLEVGVRDRW